MNNLTFDQLLAQGYDEETINILLDESAYVQEAPVMQPQGITVGGSGTGIDNNNKLLQEFFTKLMDPKMVSSIKEDYKAKQNTAHLWEHAEATMPEMIYSKPSMFMEVEINGKKIDCLVDTGAESSVITESIVKELGIGDFVDTSSKGQMSGVGTSQITGIIPCIEAKINGASFETPLFVMPNGIKYLIIGAPFMMKYQMVIDCKNREYLINGTKVNMKIKEH